MIFSRNYSNQPSLTRTLIAWCLSFTVLFQTMLPSYAAVLSDAMIQSKLDNEPGIIPTGSFIPYKASESIQISAPITNYNLVSFYQALQQSHPSRITRSLGVSVGDAAVQARLIRAQIQNLTGRTLLTSVQHPNAGFGNEAAQINQLYANTFALVASGEMTRNYGDAFSPSNTVLPNLSKAIIWPEIRVIRGFSVVVPVVYLPQVIYDRYNITENITSANGTTTASNLTVDNATIRLGHTALLDVTNDLLVNNGTIRGEQDLRITAGGRLTNYSSLVSAGGNLVIGANSVESSTLVYQYDTAVGTSSAYGRIASFESGGDLLINSAGDITLAGTQVNAPGGALTVKANGDINIGGQALYETETTRYGTGSRTTSEVTYLQSELSSLETLSLIAGGSVLIDAATLHSDQGHIEILSALGITIEDETQAYQSEASGKFGKKTSTESVYQTVAIRSVLDAGKGVRLHTDFGDITLKATDITSAEGTTVDARNGALNMMLSIETDHYQYSSVKKGTFTTKTKDRGHYIEDAIPNSIVGGLAIHAAQSVSIEYEGDDNLTMEQQIEELAKLPGLVWMQEALRSPDIPDTTWTEIETQYDTWNRSDTSLSPAFAAFIAIAVAVMTQDYTLGLAKDLVGAVSTTAASNTALVTAVQAGVSSFLSQAALATGNGLVNGDVVGAMQDLASEETLKSLATAMVTAGAIAAVDAQFMEYVNGGEVPIEKLQAVRDNLTLPQQAMQAVLQSTVEAGVNNVIQGGDFEDSFKQSLAGFAASRIGEHMAQEIGTTFNNSDRTSFDKAFQYISHAAAGCITGVVRGATTYSDSSAENYCASGAGGALAGEFVGDIYKTTTGYDEKVAAVRQLADEINGFEDRALAITQNLTAEQKLLFYNFTVTGDISYLESLPDQVFYDSLDYAFDLEDLSVTQTQINNIRDSGVDMAKLTAGFAALMADGDVNVAATNGQIAAENNAFFLIMPTIKVGSALLTAWGAYELTVDIKGKIDKYKTATDESLPPDVRADAAESLANELGEDAQNALGGGDCWLCCIPSF